MNRETIDRAAASYADSIPQFDDRKRYCREDFIAGVGWSGQPNIFTTTSLMK